MQINIHSPVTFCQSPKKLRVKSEDESATMGALLVMPAIDLAVFPAVVVHIAEA